MSTQRMNPDSRSGFALPAALFSLVIVGVMVTGGFYIAQQETRIGVASQNASTAFYIAEAGATEVAEDWDMSVYGTLDPWESTTVEGTVAGGEYSVDVLRTSTWNYLLQSTGTVTDGGALLSGATRRVGMAVRIRTALISPPAALTTQGSLRIGGSSFIDGNDQIPSGWNSVCDAGSMEDMPGILIDDTDNIRVSGKLRARGNPTLAEDAGITIESLLSFGEMGWEDLVALATPSHTFSPQTLNGLGPSVRADGSCNESDAGNWGAPNDTSSPCFNFFPIIYAKDDLKITTGSGQGILLVEGDLSVQGNFTFYGPVIVRGTLNTTGTGGHFNGGVIAANVDLDTSTVLGNAIVNYSSCAVSRAILNNSSLSQAKLLAERSWVDLSNLAN